MGVNTKKVTVFFVGKDHKAYEARKHMLEKKGKEFDTIESSNGMQIVIYENGKRSKYIYTDSKYGVKELQMFARLKREVRRNIIEKQLPVPGYTSDDIKYYRYSPHLRAVKPGEVLTIKGALELDIKMAYYFTAYQLGYISQEFYEECLQLPKFQRLRLIGSIATNKVIQRFRNREYQDPIIKKDDQLRHVWFHICYEVDKCLQEFSRIMEDRFLFYWVDGIYLGGTQRPFGALAYIFKNYRYSFTPLLVKKVEISCDQNNTLHMMVHKRNGDEKPFYVEKSQTAVKLAIIEQNRALLESLNDKV